MRDAGTVVFFWCFLKGFLRDWWGDVLKFSMSFEGFLGDVLKFSLILG